MTGGPPSLVFPYGNGHSWKALPSTGDVAFTICLMDDDLAFCKEIDVDCKELWKCTPYSLQCNKFLLPIKCKKTKFVIISVNLIYHLYH